MSRSLAFLLTLTLFCVSVALSFDSVTRVTAEADNAVADRVSFLSAVLRPSPSRYGPSVATGEDRLGNLDSANAIATVQEPLVAASDLSVKLVKCKNGGRLRGNTCICPIYYTGEDCSGRQCPNSIGGEGPYSILPVNSTTMLCDHCNTADYDGLGCHICQRDSACAPYGGASARCNRQITIRGDNKQYQCTLTNERFVRLMGDGRNISAEIMLNCSTLDGSALADGTDGRCAMAIYRVEEHNEYLDPFFRCDATKCSARNDVVQKKKSQGTLAQRIIEKIRIVGQITLVSICALLSLLGLFAHALGHRRLTRVTSVLCVTLAVLAVIFVLIMVITMRPLDPEPVVVYECRKTECACAEDPPSKYSPTCSHSKEVGQILASIKNSIRITCRIDSGDCQLSLDDIALVFDADCRAGECVDEAKFPDKSKDRDGGDGRFWTRNHIMELLMLGVVLSLAGVVVHWLYLRRRSVERAKEFLVLFNVAAGSSNSDEGIDGYGEPERADGAGAEDDDEGYHVSGNNPGERVRLLASHSQGSLDGVEGGAAVHDSAGTIRTSVIRRASRLTTDEQAAVSHVRRLTRTVLELEMEHVRYALVGSCLADQADYDSRIILNNISFKMRSGEVLAIMGASGAGKTTLLDLLSARAKSGKTEGRVLLNGTPIKTTGSSARKYRNIVGYVSQEDTLLPALTVRQSIEYAARLKLPTAFSQRTIKRIVNRMITVLKLSKCENTLVGDGDHVRGISGGEKRRVSIAVELLANPRVLILDEPTSGLDAVSAKRVVEAVVELAKDSPMRLYAPHYFAFRPIVIFSIHQPSLEIYNLFDQILLLSRGVSVYCGPALEAAAVLERRVDEAFGRTRAIPPRSEHSNPAEYLMKLEEILDDNVRADLQEEDTRVREQRLEQQYRQNLTPVRRQQRQQPGVDGEQVGAYPPRRVEEITVSGAELLNTTAGFRIYYANIYEQLGLLTSRAVTSLIGSFHLVVCHAVVVACLTSLMAFLYQEQSLDLPGALNRAGSCSFLLLVTSFVSLSCLEQLILERKLFVVERENGFYSTFPYLISKIFVDILPLRVLPAVVLSAVIYFPMGFRVDDGAHFFWFIFIIVLFSVCITLMVMCIGILTGTFGAAALLSSVFILWNFLFGGTLVQAGTIPSYLKPFVSVSPFFLAFESLLVNELDGQVCTFSPTDASGQESDVNIQILCVQYLSNIGLKPIRFSSDVMQLGIYCFGFTVLAWLLLAVCTRLVR